MSKYTLHIIAAAAALCLTGCSKGLSGDAEAGDLVSFSIQTASAPHTKTVYSGSVQTVGDRQVERIDWVVGDRLRIYSDVAVHRYNANMHYADYIVIGEPETMGTESRAYIQGLSLDNETIVGGLPNGYPMRNGLIWGEGTHAFYGVYPSPAIIGSDISFNLASRTATFSIPSAQTWSGTAPELAPDMNYAYLYAGISGVESRTPFTLAFQPMYTAFRFTVGAPEEAVVLKGFRLFSEASVMAGSCTATITAAADSRSSSAAYGIPSGGARQVSLSFGDGITLARGSELTFMVFALPQDFADLRASFTVTRTTDDIERTNTLALKYGITPPAGHAAGEWVTFPGAMKHRITCNIGPAFTQLIEVYTLGTVEDWTYMGNNEIRVP